MPENFPTLSEARAGLPAGTDVYNVVIYLNKLKTDGRIDNFRCWEGGEFFEAWKVQTNPPETWVITADLRGEGVVKDVEIETWKSLEEGSQEPPVP